MREWPAVAVPAWAGVYPTHISHMRVRGRTDLWSVPFFCIHLVIAGPMQLRMEGAVDVVLGNGDMFAIYPDRPFAYHASDTSGEQTIELYAMRLSGPLVDEYVHAQGFSHRRPHLHAADVERARSLFGQCLRLAELSSAAANPHGVAHLCELISAAGGRPVEDASAESLAERGAELMRMELSHGCNVEEIARALGVSRTTLYHHFRERFDKSPVQVLIELRLERAKALLRQTRMPVRQVALNAGYGHVSHFTRQFSRTVGCSPQKFRGHPDS